MTREGLVAILNTVKEARDELDGGDMKEVKTLLRDAICELEGHLRVFNE